MYYWLPQKHGTIVTKPVTYINSGYGYEMEQTVSLMKGNSSYAKKTGVFVAMTGSWDMAFNGIKLYLQDSGPAFVGNLSLFKKDWKKARVIWFPTVPFPLKGPKWHLYTAGDRNIFTLAAANAWMTKKILSSEPKIEVFDSMTMLFAMPNDNVCAIHYICRAEGKQFIGQSGITALTALLQQICK